MTKERKEKVKVKKVKPKKKKSSKFEKALSKALTETVDMMKAFFSGKSTVSQESIDSAAQADEIEKSAEDCGK